MTDLNNHINSYIKRKHSMYHNCQEAFVRMNIKARPNYIMSTENTLKYKDPNRLQVKKKKKEISSASTNQKKAERAILLLDKLDFREKI